MLAEKPSRILVSHHLLLLLCFHHQDSSLGKVLSLNGQSKLLLFSLKDISKQLLRYQSNHEY